MTTSPRPDPTLKFSLAGRVALVTGASSGFGERFATVLAAAGAKVACVARRADKVQAVAEAIRAAGGEAMPCVMDVTDQASMRAGFDAIEAQLGTVDVLVNNAGLSAPAPFAEMSNQQWDSVLDVNLSAPFYVAREMSRRLIAKGQPGSIINIASILGHLAKAMFVNYGTTKGAMIHMTQYMALDLLPHHIRVNAIAPGYFPTEMTNPFFETEMGQREVAALPPGRLGRLEELDGPLLLLASDASSYMNGTVLTVDYGHSIRLS
ncbi:MAG: SDR family NAD(P)-dependent oxidoreductase [Vitreoscilla sp.]|nr:SDR family NAD(P)-dependent oxidoreductase [Vitreoscilla sp.]